METPVLTQEKKLELRELQLRESVARGLMSDAKHNHDIAASNLTKVFLASKVDGFSLSPDTLEFTPAPAAPEFKA